MGPKIHLNYSMSIKIARNKIIATLEVDKPLWL